MSYRRICRTAVQILFVTLAISASAFAQQSKLGTVDFPTSGSPEAQTHFLRGLAALHSFWFDEALDEFRQSTKIDQDFMMGYWGEAMALNHPLWAQQDTDSARKVIANIKNTEKLTDRERAYLNAVKVLYGDGDKLARDIAYSKAMEKIYRDYPDDQEAACFYALSLLGTVRPGDKGFDRQMKAGQIATAVYKKNPDHPGAAHYIIHAYDDPEHANMALDAARQYAKIAPAAFHALHMPSHIFLQLGMWADTTASNEASWAASAAWVARKNLPIDQRDYHSLQWLIYSYLQQGRYAKAKATLLMLKDSVAKSRGNIVTNAYLNSVAVFVIETQQWEATTDLLQTAADGFFPGEKITQKKQTEKMAEDAKPAEHDHSMSKSWGNNLNPRMPLTCGFISANTGKADDAKGCLEKLGQISKQFSDSGDQYRAKQVRIMENELSAAISVSNKDYNAAIKSLRNATALELEMSPPSGPPDIIKPSHELLGETLLKANRPQEAVEAFKVALSRQPNRARSLIGLARAFAKAGDNQTAAKTYANLLVIWLDSDPLLPELKEARDFIASHK